jgi:60 kDa SS-A/Ro ribonucleoprotein
MANQELFKAPRFNTPTIDTTNYAGGSAYKMTSEHALAQYAFTGCFNSTFYASAKEQLDQVKKFAYEVDPVRLAKIAVLSRTKGFMKDIPAYLTAVLFLRDKNLWKKVFHRTIDNARMLRTYAQIARSGTAGKVINLSSSAHRRAITTWFNDRHSDVIFRGNVGNSPSLVGVLRQARVKPATREKEALLKYLFNSEFGWTHNQEDRVGGSLGSSFDDLPNLVKEYEQFKVNKDGNLEVPDVDFRQLDSLGLENDHWGAIFRNAKWQFTRMNLNTAQRHGVFNQEGMTDLIANRLRDADQIHRARAFPYQIFTAYLSTINAVPHAISEALQDAVEVALDNVPGLDDLVIMIDVSGSMAHPVTGDRGTATTMVRCIDAAALIASALVRKNKAARVIPFSTDVKPTTLNGRDSIMTNASKLAGLLGGGTNCSAPLALLNKEGFNAKNVLFLSDNESWVDSGNYYNKGNGTKMHEEWQRFKKSNPQAKLMCVDLTPNATSQVKERPDILQVGGFSDNVFEVMASFARGGNSANFWVAELDKVEL